MKKKLSTFFWIILPFVAFTQHYCDDCINIQVFLENRNLVARQFEIEIFKPDGKRLERTTMKTDDNGVYFYINKPTVLKVGETVKINIWKRGSGYQFFEQDYTIKEGVNNVPPIFLQRDPFILVQGNVKDQKTKDFLSGVKISFNSNKYFSDSSGFFKFPIPLKELSTDIRLTFQRPGYSDTLFSDMIGFNQDELIINMLLVKKEILVPVEVDFVYDERDKAKYRIKTINKFVFFMENNKFSTPFSEWPKHDHSLSSFGRLYTWEDAQTACPLGWRIPSKLEIQNTVELLGERKAKIILFESSNLLAGKRDLTGKHIYFSRHAYCWLSSQKDERTAFYFGTDIYGRVGIFSADKSEALSCRCIKDK